MNLTKSDFKTARTCPTKLFYKKLRYPSLDEENPYREFLADGGYMVETMARLLFPTGREVKSWEVPEQAFEDTQHALQARKVVLFEPTIVHKGLLARVDILRRDGDTLRLIEVKSSAVHTERDGPNPFRGKRGGIVSDWRPYLEDVTFQTVVLERALPQFRVVPMLCVVDKARLATAHSTFDTFQLRAELGAWRPSVDYTGDLEHLQNEHVLALLDVSHEVAELSPDVERAMDDFAATLRSEPIRRIPPELGVKCKNCEFRFPPGRDGKNGFREWRQFVSSVWLGAFTGRTVSGNPS